MEENRLNFPVVLIGGSAGSIEVLVRLLPLLPQQAVYALVIVVHRKSGDDTTLEELVTFKSSLPVAEVEDKTQMIPGHLYVAPADYHLLFEKNYTLSLDISEKVNYSRPSIDVSFESAAYAYGDRAAAILLSGSNADGTEGLRAITKTGGTAVVQDPKTAEMPFMPQHAIENGLGDFILGIEELAKFLENLNRGTT
ncbi:MAG: chemotaxis protein CheB [Flavobacterium sp.]|nr:MAG: chemotaxis protein CheB [Flavobacterium sp.]